MRLFIAVIALLSAAPALAYDIKNLSQQDVLTIGEALDALQCDQVVILADFTKPGRAGAERRCRTR